MLGDNVTQDGQLAMQFEHWSKDAQRIKYNYMQWGCVMKPGLAGHILFIWPNIQIILAHDPSISAISKAWL